MPMRQRNKNKMQLHDAEARASTAETKLAEDEALRHESAKQIEPNTGRVSAACRRAPLKNNLIFYRELEGSSKARLIRYAADLMHAVAIGNQNSSLGST